ncbi:FAD-dependent monooxygenase [Marinobacter nanhaiticus]|nr:FAD-dependent monooxygenase [Marinobacter nanhaiticus]
MMFRLTATPGGAKPQFKSFSATNFRIEAKMKILIVGGGIAGLSLAIALEQRGYQADIVEKYSAHSVSGTGLFLPGNATRAIAQLGLLDDTLDIAVPIKSQQILDSSGKQLSITHTEPFWGPCGPCLSLPRRALYKILLGAVRHTSPKFLTEVQAIRQFQKRCEVDFSDGRSGIYDLVVGADGINSAVRQMVFPEVAPAYVGNVCWRFIAPTLPGIEGWTVMLGNGRTLLAIPVSDTETYVYADRALNHHEAANGSMQMGSLFGEFSDPLSPLVENLSAETQIHFGRIEEISMPQWRCGRVILIGDAAHACSPSMAQGAGLAMEDALVLADSIATRPNLAAALASYTDRRRPRVEWVQKQCKARDKMRSMPRMARSSILKLFGNALYERSYTPLLAEI